MKVLVTGGAGFMGSWSVEHLVENQHDVICFDKLSYGGNYQNVSHLESCSNFKFVKGDIKDAQLVSKLIEENDIDTILNLAAESDVDRSFVEPLYFTENNVLGTQSLLEVVRNSTRKILFIQISTDEVYGEQDENACIDENGKLNPTNPYSATKAAIDLILSVYKLSYKLPIIIVRSNNVYGPRQYPEKIIPNFIVNLLKNQPLVIHGNGENKRKYLYVKDFVRVIDLMLTRGKIGETYNIGTDFEISNLDLSKMLVDNFHNSQSEIIFGKDRLFNDSRYNIDFDKLKKLGWQPEIEFSQGLSETITWYKKFGLHWWTDIKDNK
ncbi:hypothetical protein PACTADRAFT_77630 [Pachysolen tannophilus NRRL Y-2460]|uniref:NAD(P)-binding domain-containing protein n=1 Tax=Pachysolen tannophilus NRRL Y-2460 TaxID=669874 RepID=A0A1E4TNG7_PACTA|nr:hypothetical protein PACTADRAFT_77630 [Pachysolen tannophilus NRRL Y-2460]